jgi:hypothetical protein
MRLVKSVFVIKFDTAMNAWLEMRSLLRVASATPDAEIQAAPLVIDRAQEKKRIIVQVRAIVFEHEFPATTDEALSEIRTLMVKFGEIVSLPQIRSLKHDFLFIEPFSIPFHELVSLIKRRFLVSTRATAAASDVAIFLDTRDDEGLKSIHLGPMDRVQLHEEILRWPADDLPDTFAFLGASFQVEGPSTFTPEGLESFLRRSAEVLTESATLVIQELTEETGG